jgi:hypothetical protein
VFFLFQVEIKQFDTETVDIGPSNRPNRQIKLHLTNRQYPLMNYLDTDEESDENVINPLNDDNYQAESDYITSENIKEEDFRSVHVFTEQF